MSKSSKGQRENLDQKPAYIRTSIKHDIKPGMLVRFGMLQDGDYFRYPDDSGALYCKTAIGRGPANIRRSNARNKDYQAETFSDDTTVIAKAPYYARDDFPVGQVMLFGALQNGDEFLLNDISYRKRTDWYDVIATDDPNYKGTGYVKSSANSINEAVLYPRFNDDDMVIFVRDVAEDQSQHNWIFDSD